jgi:hypothetical protein
MSGTELDRMFASHAILSAVRGAQIGRRIGVAALAVAALMCAPKIRAAQQYEVLDHISGPTWVAGWDYAKIDPGAKYVYLAAIGSQSGVIRVDLRSKRVGEWVTAKMPHGIAFVGDGLVAEQYAGNDLPAPNAAKSGSHEYPAGPQDAYMVGRSLCG